MNINDILNQYYTELDSIDKSIIDNKVAEKGIESYLFQQLVYLDCTRIIQGMRLMQTIGYPYKREITSYMYALKKYYKKDRDCPLDINEQEEYQYDIDKLIERHLANLEYEKENPPVWYGGAKAKKAWENVNKPKPARRKKVTESTLPGFGKEVSASTTLKAKLAGCADVKFKLKLPKK